MSRNNRRSGATSPIKSYIEFSGSTGVFTYYDKAAKQRVELDKVEIILLDTRASITGFAPANKAQFSSNMIADQSKEVLTVVSWKDKQKTDIAKGLYKDIKATVKTAGGKFTTNIICLADLGKGQEVCNLQVKGSTLNGWINFINEVGANGEYDNKITISRGALSKVGDDNKFEPVTAKEEKDLLAKLKKNPRHPQPVWFYVLAFDTVELTEDEVTDATEADEVLQKFFGATPAAPEAADEADPEPEEEEEEEEANDDLPF